MIGFIVGLFIGSLIGVSAIALCTMARTNADEYKHSIRENVEDRE